MTQLGPEFARCAHENAIGISEAALAVGAVEVARLWIEDRGAATCLIRADRLATPEMFGTLMADAVQEAARAFAEVDGIGEAAALDRIWRGMEGERARSGAARAPDGHLGKI